MSEDIRVDGIKRVWVPQNDDEMFDRVEITSVERWKESELSGDEWRFTFLGYFYSHGVLMMTRHGGSIQDVVLSAGHWFRNSRSMDEPDEIKEQWAKSKAEVEDRCAQPGCANPWVVLYHPKKKYSKQGESLGLHWDDRQALSEGKPSLGWLAVRGFCNTHKYRGDCDLEDADENYELIEERPSLIY